MGYETISRDTLKKIVKESGFHDIADPTTTDGIRKATAIALNVTKEHADVTNFITEKVYPTLYFTPRVIFDSEWCFALTEASVKDPFGKGKAIVEFPLRDYPDGVLFMDILAALSI